MESYASAVVITAIQLLLAHFYSTFSAFQVLLKIRFFLLNLILFVSVILAMVIAAHIAVAESDQIRVDRRRQTEQ